MLLRMGMHIKYMNKSKSNQIKSNSGDPSFMAGDSQHYHQLSMTRRKLYTFNSFCGQNVKKTVIFADTWNM